MKKVLSSIPELDESMCQENESPSFKTPTKSDSEVQDAQLKLHKM